MKPPNVIRQMDAMIVSVRLYGGVLSGEHRFLLNDVAEGGWNLAFGDTRGEIHFGRQAPHGTNETTELLFAPELT